MHERQESTICSLRLETRQVKIQSKEAERAAAKQNAKVDHITFQKGRGAQGIFFFFFTNLSTTLLFSELLYYVRSSVFFDLNKRIQIYF